MSILKLKVTLKKNKMIILKIIEMEEEKGGCRKKKPLKRGKK